jgi:membrane-associated phospholipid phosphatase
MEQNFCSSIYFALKTGMDSQLFYFFNTVCANPIFDAIAPFWREKWAWLPFYGFISTFFLINLGKKRGFLMVAALALTVGLADFTSSTLIKKNVQRLRPCNDTAMKARVILRLETCGGGYSFPSSHAANHFAAATFLTLFFGKKPRWIRISLFSWATSIAFMQVYVGVHYPFDIFCGALLGLLIGFFGFGMLDYWLLAKSKSNIVNFK